MTPSPPPDADGTVPRRGLLNSVAQAVLGVKTFLNVIIASAGIQLAGLWNTNGTGSTDVGVKIGLSTSSGSVNAAAKPVSFRFGLGGGTEVEFGYFDATGGFHCGTSPGLGKFHGAGDGNQYVRIDSTNGVQFYHSGWSAGLGPGSFTLISGGGNVASVAGSARIDQSGTDSSAAPGAQTVAKPIGKNAIAAGASSVVITNSLVTAASVVIITPHARDTTCKELIAVAAAGSFTVSGSANATAALPFSWLVKGML